jgi:hypothetical protein
VANRLRFALRLDLPRIEPVGEHVQMLTEVLAKRLHELRQRTRLHVGDRAQPGALELLLRRRPYAPQTRHRQRRQEGPFFARRHHHERIGFAQVTGHLGHVLRRSHTDRHPQLRLRKHVPLDRAADRFAFTKQRAAAGHVEERFVQRQRLDEVV